MAASYLGRTDLPRGLRNNNPGNLRVTGDQWQGMIGDDGAFVQFSDMSWGLRAMGTVIGHDLQGGLNTVTKLISEYAPASENDTAAYIARVCQISGFTANQVLPLNMDTLERLIRAQVTVELGDKYASLVTDADIQAGLRKMNPTLLSSFNISAAEGGGIALIVAAGLLAWWTWHK